MFCANCGNEISERAAFCPQCGAKVEHGPVQEEPVKHKGPRRLLLIFGIAAAAAVLGVGAFFLYQALIQDVTVLKLSDVPDEAFRSYLSLNVDVDQNGEISHKEADAVTDIGSFDEEYGVSGGLISSGISDLSGIEVFRNLETLVCDYNSLTTIDVSKNSKLRTLSCSANQLSTLDVSSCNALERLDCNDNQISDLRLPGGDSLRTIYAYRNAFESVDLSGCEGLTALNFDEDVTIIGKAFEPSDDNRDKLAELAMCFAISYVNAPADSTVIDEGLYPGGYAWRDASLVWNAVNTKATDQHFGLDGTRIEATILGRDAEQDDGSYAISDEDVAQLLRSFYGEDPGDVSYLNGVASFLTRSGSLWILSPGSGVQSTGVWVANFEKVGHFVSYDLALSYTVDNSNHSIFYYHMRMREDSDSLYGYSIVDFSPYEGSADEFEGLTEWAVVSQFDMGSSGSDSSSTDAMNNSDAVAESPCGRWKTTSSGSGEYTLYEDGTCKYYYVVGEEYGTWAWKGARELTMRFEDDLEYDFTYSGDEATLTSTSGDETRQLARVRNVKTGLPVY